MADFQPRFKGPGPFYTDLTPAAFSQSPATECPGSTLQHRRRVSSADVHSRDRVGALLHGNVDAVDPSEVRRIGRAMVKRDPNAESDPAVASHGHPKMLESHVRHIAPPEHEEHAEGKRHVPAPHREEPADDIIELAHCHKRRIAPPEAVAQSEHVGDLLVDPPEASASPSTASTARGSRSGKTGSGAETRRDRSAIAAFVNQRQGGLRPLWVRISRGEFLAAANVDDIPPCPNRDGSVPLIALWAQLQVLMSREISPASMAEIFTPVLTQDQGVSVVGFAKCLDL